MVKYTNERMRRDLKKFLNKVKKHYNIKNVIIFGSRARGDYFLDSDVDIILISNDFKDIRFTDRIGNIIEFWNPPIDLEVICYTPEEFEKKKKQIGIVKTAVEEGIEVKWYYFILSLVFLRQLLN